jgi:hypothetical protein
LTRSVRNAFRRRALIPLGFVSVALGLLPGCGTEDGHPPFASDTDGGSIVSPPFDPCWSPTNSGCPCETDNERVRCGTVQEQRGEYLICSMGARVCSGRVWGQCVAERLLETSTSQTSERGLRLQALSAAADCENPCDPRCMAVADTPDGVVVDDDLVADPSGITLPGATFGGSCSDLVVSPPTATIVISAIASNGSVTASPANLTLSATCSGGSLVEPSWTMDAYDRAVINEDGKLTVFSGVASPIIVTGASSADSSNALVDVVVRLQDRGVGATQIATANAFDAAGTSSDAGKTLYPYRNTVFPLDLKAPLVQWQTGGTAATDVQVALRFPKDCVPPTPSGPASTCRFWYSKIYYGSEPTCTPSATGPCLTASVPAWQIPQEIWTGFDRSAKGDATGGEIIIQRRYAGVVRPEMKIPVKFASDSLHGTVYYTQYVRGLNSAAGTSVCTAQTGCNYSKTTYVPGRICPVGGGVKPATTVNISGTRAIDLSQPAALNKDPFNGTGGCPVCHSVSANGTTYVGSSQFWLSLATPPGTSVGINSIGFVAGEPRFTPISTGYAPSYSGLNDVVGAPAMPGAPWGNAERIGEDSRGFAYSAITPDGALTLQGTNFVGNTVEFPAGGINSQDATAKGLTGAVKPYFFVKTSLPGLGVQLATTGALPSNTWSAGTITSTSAVSLQVDGFTLNTVGQAVLVKNEASAFRNGVYHLTVVSPWKLARRYDADSVAELPLNMEVRVSDGVTNRGDVFYISAVSAGTFNSSKTYTFASRALPAVTYTAAPLVAKLATTAALSPAIVTQAGNVLTAGANGALTIDGQAVALNDVVLVKNEGTASRNGVYSLTTLGTGSVRWKLTRTTSADEVSATELRSGMDVRVTNGSSNAGKVFYLSSPAYGAAFTINSTSIAFGETSMPSMMVPAFSPDGTKVAYVNADADPVPGAGATGWRRGLSMFSFDQATLAVSNKKRLRSTYSSGSNGTPMKWPFFENDSRSLIYVETDATEYCDSTDAYPTTVDSDVRRACVDAAYGSMSPTTRGYWPGKIYSMDTQNPSATRVELANLNDAEDSLDADHAYQPTVLPFSAGGYRWVIFTSPRAFGNQLNYKNATGTVGTHFSCAASQLWVSALTDTVASGTDRSHPAFLLPGQYLAPVTADDHYINERGYLVPTPCKAVGASCTTDNDCCGAGASPATAACRAPSGWTPASGPPARTCAATGGTCSNAGGSCNSPADCCNAAACVDYQCAAPPTFTEADFARDYVADCPDSTLPEWQLLSYHLTTGGDSRLEFSVQTAETSAGLAAAPVIDLGQSLNTVVSPADPEYKDVGAALEPSRTNGRKHVRVKITFVPSSDAQTAPVLHDWEMRYTCQDAL